MKNYVISEELVNGILQYLGQRPYVEVMKLIEGIQSTLKEVTEKKKEEEDGE